MNPQPNVETGGWFPDDRYWDPPFHGYVSEWEQFIRKDGKGGRWQERMLDFCHIHTCERCGRHDGAHHVRSRSDLWRLSEGACTLCTTCARALRPLARLQNEALELARLARKLLRTKPDGHEHR